MTSTLDRPETAAPAAPDGSPASFVWAPSWSLLADLVSVGACASTDKARPLLESVHLHSAPGYIVAESTDSYALAQARTKVDGDAELDVVISAKWLRDLLKATKPKARERREVLLSVTGDIVTAKAGGVTLETTTIPGNYPTTSHLVPAEADYTSELGAFNPAFLSRMADVLPRKTPTTWDCVSMSRDKPSVWRATVRGQATGYPVVGGEYTIEGTFLLMPVRIR